VNVLPAPGAESTVAPPPCSMASSDTSASPMPDPSWLRERAPDTRWNRSNRRAWSAGSMPMPVSATDSSTRSSRSRIVTVMPPVNVNFNALESRLRTIFAHISRSTYTGSGSIGQSTVRLRPARSIAGWNMLVSSDVYRDRSTGS
jgi:hypothetical protein